MSDPKMNQALGELDGALNDLRKLVLNGGSANARVPVEPLPSISTSPILTASNGPPQPTHAYRSAPADVPPPPAQVTTAPPPPPAPVRPLRPMWTLPITEENPSRRERISSDGGFRLAYEMSTETDAVGDPIWRRVTLPFSAEAEQVMAQFCGAAIGARAIAHLLRTVAYQDVDMDKVKDVAQKIMATLGIPIDGPILDDVVRKGSLVPVPMPVPTSNAGNTGFPGTIIETQHENCVLVIAIASEQPSVGDHLHAEGFEGRISRVVRKDAGYDLLVIPISGMPSPGPITISRPATVVSPT